MTLKQRFCTARHMSVLAAHCSEIASRCGSLAAGTENYTGVVLCRQPVSHNVIGGTDNGGKCRMAVDGGARMGALRRAGVWLGLVEDEEERGYDDRHYRG